MKTSPGHKAPVQGVLVFGDECAPNLVRVADRVKDFFARSAPQPSSRPKGRKVVVEYTKAVNLELPLLHSLGVVPDASDDIQPQMRGDASPTELAYSPVEDPATEVDGPVVATSDVDEKVPFPDTLEAWCAAHAGVLYRSLEVLLWSKGESSKARREIVDWIFTEVVTYTDPKDGKTFRVKARDFPFSFETCCMAEGIDVEYARERIWLLLERVRQGATVKKAALH